MKAVGGVKHFKEIMLWLPTWNDARRKLKLLEVTDERVADRLEQTRAIQQGNERLVLYQLIESALAEQTAQIDF